MSISSIEREGKPDFRLPPPYPIYPSPERFEVVNRRNAQEATEWLNSLHQQAGEFSKYARTMRETGKAPVARMILFQSAGSKTGGSWIYQCLTDNSTYPSSRRQERDVKEHLERDHYLDYSGTERLTTALKEELLDFHREVQLGAEVAGWQQRLKLWWTSVPLLTRDIAVQRLEEREQAARLNTNN